MRHRNCNVKLDDLDWDRPDLDREPQQARGIRAIFNGTRQLLSCPGEGCTTRVKVAP